VLNCATSPRSNQTLFINILEARCGLYATIPHAIHSLFLRSVSVSPFGAFSFVSFLLAEQKKRKRMDKEEQMMI
jgi:hypothetical protein